MTFARPIDRATVSVTAIFMAHSVVFSSWLAHIPEVKRQLRLSDAALGVALFGNPLGGVLATTLCLWALPRLGSHRLVPLTVAGYAMSGAALSLATSELWLFLALALVGFFQGGLDVAMNTQAATVERLVAAPIMPRFHGMRSLGVLVGAAIGAGCASAGVGLTVQLTVLGVLVIIGVEPLTRYLIRQPAHAPRRNGDHPARRWMTPHVAILAAVSFGSFLCEGTAADWSANYLRSVVGAAPAVSALGYAAFTLMVAVTRLGAVPLYRRVQVRRLLPALALAGAAGMCVMLATGGFTVSLVGLAALGAGVALLVPAAMTASYATSSGGSAIAVVAAAGWVGYLTGPPLVGGLAQWAGLSVALLVVPIAITSAAIAIRFTRAFDAADEFRSDTARA